VPAGSGAEWIAGGWAIFRRAPGAWIAVTLVCAVISLACGLLPYVAGILNAFVSTLLGAGLLLTARKVQETGSGNVGELFAIFRHPSLGPVLLVAAIYLGLLVCAVLIAVLAAVGLGLGAAAFPDATSADAAMAGVELGALLLCVLVFFVLLAAVLAMYWFAVPQVVFGATEPWSAMKQSLLACVLNPLPLLVYGVLGLVLLLVAALPLGLGMLIAVPVMSASWLLSYQEIFADGADSAALY
jgi:uncharacterized membrane protein